MASLTSVSGKVMDKIFLVGISTRWYRLPRGIVMSPSIEIVKTQLDRVSGNLLYLALLELELYDLKRSLST